MTKYKAVKNLLFLEIFSIEQDIIATRGDRRYNASIEKEYVKPLEATLVELEAALDVLDAEEKGTDASNT